MVSNTQLEQGRNKRMDLPMSFLPFFFLVGVGLIFLIALIRAVSGSQRGRRGPRYGARENDIMMDESAGGDTHAAHHKHHMGTLYESPQHHSGHHHHHHHHSDFGSSGWSGGHHHSDSGSSGWSGGDF